MKSFKGVVGLSLLLTAMAAIGPPASAAQLKAKTAVLVHGAFADGSSWEFTMKIATHISSPNEGASEPLKNVTCAWAHLIESIMHFDTRYSLPTPKGDFAARLVAVVLPEKQSRQDRHKYC